MKNSAFSHSVKYLSLNLVGDVLNFPIWWYTKGFLRLLKFVGKQLVYFEKILGLLIKIKNLFKPMFQDYTFAGLVIGIIIRTFVLTFDIILYFLILVVAVLTILFYLLLPIFVVRQIFYFFYE
ncbi:MAG: hypothetical protein ABIE68_04515 [bacterium]